MWENESDRHRLYVEEREREASSNSFQLDFLLLRNLIPTLTMIAIKTVAFVVGVVVVVVVNVVAVAVVGCIRQPYKGNFHFMWNNLLLPFLNSNGHVPRSPLVGRRLRTLWQISLGISL